MNDRKHKSCDFHTAIGSGCLQVYSLTPLHSLGVYGPDLATRLTFVYGVFTYLLAYHLRILGVSRISWGSLVRDGGLEAEAKCGNPWVT